ncbi:hypothetical protein ACHAXT_008823 [Thalassiosira profunda]
MRPWLLLAATVVGAARGLQSLPLRRAVCPHLPQQHRIVLQTSSSITRRRVHLMSTAPVIHKDDAATVATPFTSDETIDNISSGSNKLAKELGAAFAERLSELEEYRRAHGHCLVPKRYEGSPALGNWVNKQRQNYRRYARGEKTSMNDKRIAALNDIGFVWDATAQPQRSGHSDAAWQRMHDRLALFHAENGHCRVPSTSPLGQWVVRQRFLYRQQPSGRPKSSLTAERINLLNRLDFPWTTRSEQLWQERISDLRRFQEEHGHAMVPRTYVPNPQLSAWVATQRKNYHRRKNGKASPLTLGRIEELEGMGFVWSYWDYNFIRANGGAE